MILKMDGRLDKGVMTRISIFVGQEERLNAGHSVQLESQHSESKQ